MTAPSFRSGRLLRRAPYLLPHCTVLCSTEYLLLKPAAPRVLCHAASRHLLAALAVRLSLLPRREGRAFFWRLWLFAQVRGSSVHGRLRRAPQMFCAGDNFGSAEETTWTCTAATDNALLLLILDAHL